MTLSKAKFDQDGFLAFPGFLNVNELKELRNQLERYETECISKLPKDSVFYEVKDQPKTLKQFPIKSDLNGYFGGLLNEGRFRRLAEELLTGDVVPKNLQWLNKPTRVGAETPPHQDGYYYMLEPNEAVAMWLALDDADEQNGCMRYIPGSHQKGLRDHVRGKTLGFSQGIPDYDQTDREMEAAVSAKPGDLLVHHSLTIHRADSNKSGRERRALQFVYFSVWAKEDVERKARYNDNLMKELATAGKI